MPNTIRHKRGTTTPAAASLVTGEIAINTATGVAFTKTDAGSVVSLGGLSTADIGAGSTTAGNLILAGLQNANAPSSTNPYATEGDLNSAVASFSAQVGSVKAWVNFNGTGTVAIRAAFNVSSITDNGVGTYTVNFTTALQDSNYATVTTANRVSGTTTYVGMSEGTRATTSVQVVNNYGTNTPTFDTDSINVAVFR